MLVCLQVLCLQVLDISFDECVWDKFNTVEIGI